MAMRPPRLKSLKGATAALRPSRPTGGDERPVGLYAQRPKSLRRLVGYPLSCPHRRAAERHAVSFARQLAS
jgi:hypothetical protein